MNTESSRLGPLDPRDENFMRRALDLADLPSHSLLPNPRVGAVIVQNNTIVGEGLHRGPGAPHAEVAAIENATQRGMTDFRKSCLFVTLEPCCTFKNKKTGPCTPLLIQKKFKRVVIAHQDANPLVAGRGIKALKEAGIHVDIGLLEQEAILINQSFIKNQILQMPYITLKMALTFDGKLHDDFRESQWITSEEARADVHRWRARSQAIGIGKGTLEKDDPQLTVRGYPRMKTLPAPKIIVFGKPSDKQLRSSQIARRHGLDSILVVSRPRTKAAQNTTARRASRLWKTQLKGLYSQGIGEIFIEGGPRLASSLLKAGQVDQLVLYYGRGILGGARIGSLGLDWGLRHLHQSISFQPQEARLLGPDCRVSGTFHVYRPHPTKRSR